MANQELYWDATYAIALALLENYPQLSVQTVGLDQLFELVINLPDFQDDPELATERILLDILNVWYEET